MNCWFEACAGVASTGAEPPAISRPRIVAMPQRCGLPGRRRGVHGRRPSVRQDSELRPAPEIHPELPQLVATATGLLVSSTTASPGRGVAPGRLLPVSAPSYAPARRSMMFVIIDAVIR